MRDLPLFLRIPDVSHTEPSLIVTGLWHIRSLHPNPPLEVTTHPPSKTNPVRAMPGRVSICLARRFDDHPLLWRITCLPITDTGLFFNWAPNDPLLYDSVPENYYYAVIASVQAFNGGWCGSFSWKRCDAILCREIVCKLKQGLSQQ